MTLARVVLASNNLGKLNEMGSLLEPLGIELIPQRFLGIGEAGPGRPPHAVGTRPRDEGRHAGRPRH